MIRSVFAAVILAVVLRPGAPCHAQEQATSAPTELQSLRQLLEQQSRQLETLTQQVAKLTQFIEASHNRTATSAAPTVTQNTPLQETNPPAAPVPAAGIPVATAVPSSEPVKTDGTEPSGPTHTVAKGETLTSIARQYKISINELQRVNKIENDRKLQIGQTLIVPPPKALEAAPEKKD